MAHLRKLAQSTYNSWANMIQRCTNPRNPTYPRYGGRHLNPVVIEDPRWRKFSQFFADMKERPDGTTIDRIDNQRGYCKDNCRWATAFEQVHNRRKTGEGNYARGVPKPPEVRIKLCENLRKAIAAKTPEVYAKGWETRRANAKRF